MQQAVIVININLLQKNKPYTFTTEEGKQKTLFDGRYACVCAMVLVQGEKTLWILANKRGPGCPNEVDKWNMPCGYMDAGSAEENCSKEVYEETGLKISPDEFSLIGISDTGKERNVTLRYIAVLHGEKPELPSVESLKGLGGEENEVSEIKWIDINFLDKYKWAFNHDKVIEKTLMEAYQYQKAQQIAKQTIENNK